MGRHRPIRFHRFVIETDLATAGDIDDESLARVLTRLATAGLHGMVLTIRQVVLDGTQHPVAEDDSGSVQHLRPPPDERIGEALRELEHAAQTLRAVISLPSVGQESVA